MLGDTSLSGLAQVVPQMPTGPRPGPPAGLRRRRPRRKTVRGPGRQPRRPAAGRASRPGSMPPDQAGDLPTLYSGVGQTCSLGFPTCRPLTCGRTPHLTVSGTATVGGRGPTVERGTQGAPAERQHSQGLPSGAGYSVDGAGSAGLPGRGGFALRQGVWWVCAWRCEVPTCIGCSGARSGWPLVACRRTLGWMAREVPAAPRGWPARGVPPARCPATV